MAVRSASSTVLLLTLVHHVYAFIGVSHWLGVNHRHGPAIVPVCSSPRTSSSTVTASDYLLLSSTTVPVGGDFCGLSASFTRDGQLIPIPDHWIPNELLEWGQVPTALEVLVSEQPPVETSTTTAEADDISVPLTRHVTTILPATGCAVDNQEVVKTTEEYKIVAQYMAGTTRAMFLASDTLEAKHVLEVSFGLAGNHRTRIRIPICRTMVGDGAHGSDMTTTTRDVSAALSGPALQLVLADPISILLERQVSPDSTHGTIADGGGLDGQRVAHMRGPWLTSRLEFANERQPPVIAATEQHGVVNFPGNVTIASHADDNGRLNVEVTHWDGSALDDATTSTSRWQTVRAVLSVTKTGIQCAFDQVSDP